MSWYSTPLQFAYIFSLLFALIFAFRGWQEERLNKKLLAFLMLIMALELQDYTFGFSGINILWNEYNGFPRGVNLLFGPAMFFYLKAQLNRNFKLKPSHALHLGPWAFFFLPQLLVFLMGPEQVEKTANTELHQWMTQLAYWMRLFSYAWYFYQSWRILKTFRLWLKNRFSQVETVSMAWFQNFIFIMVSWVVFRELMNIIDSIADLPFKQDWWWNLALAFAAVYVGISGLNQRQPADLVFEEPSKQSPDESTITAQDENQSLMQMVDQKMEKERFFLQPELTLRELAAQLKLSASDLSGAINATKKVNYNDYVNAWRVMEFIRVYPLPENKAYTILSIAYDCGFNSKATFNRAFKKETGKSPKEYFA